ncbi:MAG TPA: dihydrolipoamide acetyltransferase family protein [Solirubrobacteraceae bacterium]|jgi:pyruvate dehydrogenase E2 component (dihydrolipoamide acetyltransferase)|nr:dihydrolipoamide acetyltransferase family protein [Solirubrobacteraceae bacterium]
MTDVVMPRLSDTMEEGTILRWLKQDGEHVARGEELVEIETDKASMTYASDREGTLQRVAQEGDTLAVGEPIARIGEGTPAAPIATPHQTTPNGTPDRPERVKASPLARRVANETGVDLAEVTGSGPGGRIVKADVEAQAGPAPTASEKTPAEPAPAPTVSDVAAAKGETSTVELSRTQRTIARRMAESKATIPDFTLTADVDMEACVALRAELKRLSHDEAPTYNDMIVKACALALREHPRANGSYRDGRFELHSRVNVGVAVAVDSGDPTSGALVVPTVFDADGKALGEIARETRTLAQRVRDGSITPPELGGGTFTVSNLGMYGIRQFTAIVNPPQAAILAVGAVEPRAVVVRKKKIAARQQMSVTLACDHRILYGADAALFLARVRELLEEPAALTL